MTRGVARSSILEGLRTTEWAKLEKIKFPLSMVDSGRPVGTPMSLKRVIETAASGARLSPVSTRVEEGMVNLFGGQVLLVVPHADDEILGCGGLFGRLRRDGVWLGIAVAPLSEDEISLAAGKATIREQQAGELRKVAEVYTTEVVSAFSDKSKWLDTAPAGRIVFGIDVLIAEHKPSTLLLLLLSFPQDHKAVYEAGMAALRPHQFTRCVRLIALYEYPYVSSWHHEFTPPTGRLYMPITREDADQEKRVTQLYKSKSWEGVDLLHPTSTGSIKALLRMRGRECGVELAELLHLVQVVMAER